MVRPESLLTRRRALRLLALAGGAATLAACRTAPAATVPPAASPPRPGPPTPAAVVAATDPVAASPARASVPGSPTASRPSPPGTPAATSADLVHLLAQIPAGIAVGTRRAVWFAAAARQRRNYGGAAVGSFDDFQALPRDQLDRLERAIVALPLPIQAGAEFHTDFGWRAAIGFDLWQVDHTLYVSVGHAGVSLGDTELSHLVGQFDPAVIGARLRAIGYQPRAYRGTEILDRTNLATATRAAPEAKGFINATRFAIAGAGTLIATHEQALIEAPLDAAAGAAPTLAAEPDYRILAGAFDGAVGAGFLPAGWLYRGTPPTGLAPANLRYATPLPAYRLVGLALQDDGVRRTLSIALVYASEADASAAGPLLRQRLDEYVLDPRVVHDGPTLDPGQTRHEPTPLRERLVPGAPSLRSDHGRVALVQPLTILAEKDSILWLRMLVQGDTGFLREQ